MRKKFENNECAFCNVDRKVNEIIFEDLLVYAWHAPEAFMRKELAFHWIVVPRRHVRFEAELTDEEVLSIHKAKRLMAERFSYVGGLTHVREGDMRLNGGTVTHLHYNTFVPNQKAEVRIPVFKDPQDREKNRLRAAHFAARYESEMFLKAKTS